MTGVRGAPPTFLGVPNSIDEDEDVLEIGLLLAVLLILYHYVLMLCRLLRPFDYLKKRLKGDIWGAQDRR